MPTNNRDSCMADGNYFQSAQNLKQRIRQYAVLRHILAEAPEGGDSSLTDLFDRLDKIEGTFAIDLAAEQTKRKINQPDRSALETYISGRVETLEEALGIFFDANLSRVAPELEEQAASVPTNPEAEDSRRRATATSGLLILMFLMPGAHKFSGLGIELSFGPGMAILLAVISTYLVIDSVLKGRTASRSRSALKAQVVNARSAVQEAVEVVELASKVLPPTTSDAASRWIQGAKNALKASRQLDIERIALGINKLWLPIALTAICWVTLVYHLNTRFPTNTQESDAQRIADSIEGVATQLQYVTSCTGASPDTMPTSDRRECPSE